MRQIITSLIIVGTVCVVLADDDPKRDELDNEGRSTVLAAVQTPNRRLTDYHKWPMLTNGLLNVTDDLFTRCDILDPADRNAIYNYQRPSGTPAIRVYANSIAKAAIDGKKKTFPEGSILVKEKVLQNKIFAITAMFRESDGYDRARGNNNWRYFYVDQSEEMQYGRIESCRTCHRKAAETDFAFLKYSTTRSYSSP